VAGGPKTGIKTLEDVKLTEGDDIKTPEEPTPVPEIQLHTITLPARAPKQVLLDLKHVLQTYPGNQRIQLKIGEQMIPLPLTVTMSPLLEKKIDEVLASAEEK